MKILRSFTLIVAFLVFSTALCAQSGRIATHTQIFEKLDSTKVPSLKLKKVPLSKVIDLLNEQSLELDPGPVVTGVTFINLDQEKGDPLVSITLRNSSLRNAVDLTTRSIGYTWDLKDGAVIIFEEKEKVQR